MNTLFPSPPHVEGARLTLRGLCGRDEAGLQALMDSPEVYRYLPAFLFEKRFRRADEVLPRLYTDCLRESLILGIFERDRFLGLAECYGYRPGIRKISVGYRLLPDAWGRGFATEALGLLLRLLEDEADVAIVTASTMVENLASARVLTKNGFERVVSAVLEDWGYDRPTVTDKWLL